MPIIYLGGWDQKMVWGQLKQIVRETHIFKNNQDKIDWSCGSRGRVPVLQAWSPEFRPQSHQKQQNPKTRCGGLGL
jgi:hypothetical protein